MKKISFFCLLIEALLTTSCIAGTQVWPATTNRNQTFYGTNTFVAPIQANSINATGAVSGSTTITAPVVRATDTLYGNLALIVGTSETPSELSTIAEFSTAQLPNGLNTSELALTNISTAFGFKGRSLPSFILTNGITGVTTNYTYFTNGLAFTNIVGDAWVAWP